MIVICAVLKSCPILICQVIELHGPNGKRAVRQNHIVLPDRHRIVYIWLPEQKAKPLIPAGYHWRWVLYLIFPSAHFPFSQESNYPKSSAAQRTVTPSDALTKAILGIN
jgi:hypothetical protein